MHFTNTQIYETFFFRGIIANLQHKLSAGMKIRIPFVLLTALLLLSAGARAQVPIVKPGRSGSTKIAPAYFGPNAFPVPEMSDGRPHASVYAELAGDYFRGHLADGQDDTWDAFMRVSLPLWTPRATLELWMPVYEGWAFSPAVAAQRRMEPGTYRGHDAGDVYVCTSLHVLEGRDNGWKPDILVRAVLKSASGGTFEQARYYDCPGYFFDLTVGEGFRFEGFVRELRLALSTGFLCWQTDIGRQNDAVMGGALATLDTDWFTLGAEMGGYFGWEKDGDRPVRARLRLDLHPWEGPLRPFVQTGLGLYDYPFTQFRAGLAWSL